MAHRITERAPARPTLSWVRGMTVFGVAALVSQSACESEACDRSGRVPTKQEKDACQGYSVAQCASIERCSRVAIGKVFGTAERCRARMAESCETIYFSKRYFGKTPQGVDSCATAINTAPCTGTMYDQGLTVLPDECRTGPGTRPNGAECDMDSQCQSEYCKPDNEVGGRCSEPPVLAGPGEPCPCASGLFCVSGQCVEPVEFGGACDEAHPCAGYQAVCNGGTCAEPIHEGDPCTPTQVCQFGFGCQNAICVELPENSDPLGGWCDAGTLCSPYCCAGGKCQICKAYGEPCATASECAPGTCTAGKCAAFHYDEEACLE